MEKMEGTALGEIWYSMTTKDRHRVMKQIVELEHHLFSLELPASGSIYFQDDLRPEEKAVAMPMQNDEGKAFCIGPMAHYSWWHDERELLDADRGPCEFTSKFPIPFRILTSPRVEFQRIIPVRRAAGARLVSEVCKASPPLRDSL